jgi:4-aminobutyrate aminotransferase-like enzyme
VIRFHTSGDVACFLAEPALGEGGIIIPPKGYFKAVKQVLDKHGILFVVDEVQSGFGRTGAMFAIEHYGVEPDILVTAKGIADGFPLGAFTTRDEIAAAFQPGDHLSTFGGNPVCCAAALANIEYMQREDVPGQARRKGNIFSDALEAMQKKFKTIGEVRGIGLMIGIELVADEQKTPAAAKAEEVRAICLHDGVLIGVGGVNGNVVRIQPPLIISEDEIAKVLAVLERAIASVN